MSERTFDRETLLDLTVNVIPLGIILFFAVVYLLVRPWDFDPFITAISMGLLIVPFVSLALLTYLSGRAVSEAEGDAASATAIDDSFEESPALESNETEASDDTTAGVVTDDEAAALDDGSDTGEDADESTDADAETTATEDENDTENAEESGDGDSADESDD